MKSNKIQFTHTIIVSSRMRPLNLLTGLLIFVLLSSCKSLSFTSTSEDISALTSTYYVDSRLGSDTNSGSRSRTWKTIQECLDQVRPGDICLIMGGTYEESLVLKTSGTASSTITIKCEIANECIVSSGNGTSLVTQGRIHYYIIDGLKFTSNTTKAYSIDFGANIWDGENDKNGGNNGFILRNCYVEGAINIYGHDNLIENCELNGKGVYGNGIRERFAASHDNVYRNNKIHDYKVRGIWSMQRTDNILIEGNTVYNTGGSSIDCDAAANNQRRCFVRNNIIHNTDDTAILFENCFDCIAEGNTIYNVGYGIGVINYGIYPDGYSTEDGKEYRNINTNIIIRKNVIFNAGIDGINCAGSPGGIAVNNTIYESNQSRGYFGGIGLSSHGDYYCHNWTIKNNIFSQPAGAAIFLESGSTDLVNIVSNNNFFDIAATAKRFNLKRSGTDIGYTFSQWQAFGFDSASEVGTPLFVDPTTGNFHLQPNSPACMAGENGSHAGAFPCR